MLLLISIAILAVTCVSAQTPEPSCICLEELEAARDFKNPLRLTHAGDGTRRRFVAEQVGLVWVFRPDGTKLEEPFLNITEVILTSDRPGDERGFLSLTFHPNFRNNRKLYVWYSLLINDDEYTRLAELQTDPNNPDRVDHASERILLDILQPFGNHNGGDIIFGTDGLLYLFTGDGGLAGDPFDLAQNKQSFLGKVLRLDIDRTEPGKPYAVPADNPYLNESTTLPELYSIGWRNPWRGGMDRGDRQTGAGRGRIFMGDVGQSAWEEIDILESGGNFGWPAREGPECYKPALCGNIGPEVFPIYAYNHSVGQCIIGGFVYRGCESPGLNGLYFFGDYMNGKLFRIKEENGSWKDKEVKTCSQQVCSERGLINTFAPRILSWGEDEDGEQYFLSTMVPSPTDPKGRVYKIVDPFNRAQPCISS